MTFEDATSIKVGGNNVSAVYVGGTLVWPSNFDYVIVQNTVAVHYSSGSQINAAGSNYAYFTGDVQVRRGQIIIRTISDARLTPTLTSASAAFYISGTEVHAYSRGSVAGEQRYISAMVSYNGSSSVTGGTVYQQANAITSYTYNLAIAIDVTGTIPAEGGRYDVIYTSQRTPTYTSGASGSAENCTASITGTNCTPNINTVTGVESLNIGVDENTSTSVTPTVSVTISAGGYFATDSKTQDAAPVVPQATIYPEVESDGSVVMRFFMTQGSYPGGLVVVEGAVYHYVMDGTSTEETVSLSMKTFTGDGGSEALPVSVHYFSGDAGEHWFTATRVSKIGLNNTTFPHKDFEVR